ncbi:beta-lactamase/transpeptidase-like protein [Nemania abortiva]|nr:beta-lactamase/transpeptidase-like protein [Nemania abortiva]
MQVVTSSPILQRLSPSIKEILQVSGAAGASIGVLDGFTGKIHLAGCGYRDVEQKLPPDEHTVYHIASLSKSFTAVSIALLVADGLLSFEDPICKVLPGFRHDDPEIHLRSTLLDFLSHRTGLATKNSLWQQDGHELLLQETDTMLTVSYLETIAPLRSKWIYNNWGYDLLSQVISEKTGSAWGEFVSKRILKPLNLKETTTSLRPPRKKDWAHGYMPGPSCELTNVGRPVIADGTVQQGANGVKSTVHDLLIYYKAVMDTYRLETEEGIKTRPGPATQSLRNVKALLAPYIPLDPDAGAEAGDQWYGAGWAIAELPAPLGSMGTNGMFIDPMPLVGKGCTGKGGTGKQKIWYHNGSLVGFFSSVHILPESGTIIVVLANSITKNDATDWIGQLLVEDFLGCKERNDYVALAKESAKIYDEMWSKLPDDVAKAKSPGSHSRPLSEYAGRYFNAVDNWFIEVTHDADGLAFSFQGRSTQTHRLEVFGPDTFGWPLTEEQSRRRGRWPDLDVEMYFFYFGTDNDGSIETLRWKHDPDVAEGEVFVKNKGNREQEPEILEKHYRLDTDHANYDVPSWVTSRLTSWLAQAKLLIRRLRLAISNRAGAVERRSILAARTLISIIMWGPGRLYVKLFHGKTSAISYQL